MNDPATSPESPDPRPAPPATRQPPDAWTANLQRLRERFPDAREGVLFCVHKLEQSPDARLTDFRDEAALYGIPLSGRSLNSAKVLLGLAERPTRKPKAERAAPASPADKPRAFAPAKAKPGTGAQALEAQLTDALQQIQSAATAQSQRLREAMHEAIRVLERALEQH